MQIRDQRIKEKYFIDDAYLNGYAKYCGVNATAVYNSLCRHANKKQECFPSMEKIAEQHGISRRSVLRAVKELQKRNIISVEKVRGIGGKYLNNLYKLLDKSQWKLIPSDLESHGSMCQKSSSPCDKNDTNHVTVSHTKDTHIKDTHIRKKNNFRNIALKAYKKELKKNI